ncbi:hypothetical protein BGZ63DRAFT_405276 [Mariannaea sp. PMI_226]|nr:hypothetical protein BGZ63DRAFT_405276 [Mariannaea sp. PMI_226]
MVSALAIATALLGVASNVQATRVTKFVLDISGGLGIGKCSSVVSFDDAPDVELQGCASDSNGITVGTNLGPVTVKCDVNAGPSGANQCLNQRVVCRSGCCVTIDLESSNAACTIPDVCTSGDCTICAEQTGKDLPLDLKC